MRIDKMNNEYKFYSNIYWVLWSIFIIIFLLGNIFKIYIFKNIPFESFFGIFFILEIIRVFNRMKLKGYLEKNHHEKWNELFNSTTNEFHIIKFFYSKDPSDDLVLTKLKSECKKTFLLSLTHAFSIPIFFIGLRVLEIT